MADAKDPISWYVWFTELSIVPPEYHYVLRMISWFFITLALVPIVPIVGLVIYDFSLWMWRLYGASKEVKQQAVQKLRANVASITAEPPDDNQSPDGSARKEKADT